MNGLGLFVMPADHSGWARSVRWSCGRPSMWGQRGPLWTEDRWAAEYERAVRDEYVRAWVGARILSPTSVSFVVNPS